MNFWSGEGSPELVLRRGTNRLYLGGLATALTVRCVGPNRWILQHDAFGIVGRRTSKTSAIDAARTLVRKAGQLCEVSVERFADAEQNFAESVGWERGGR